MDHAEAIEVPAERRPFRLGDAIALVAAAALAMAGYRAVGPPHQVLQRPGAWPVIPTALSLALLPYQLSRRDDRRRMAGGCPGLWAHAAAAVPVAIRCAVGAAELTLMWALMAVDEPMPFRPGRMARMLLAYDVFEHPADRAFAVALAWAALGLAGRWRPERSWDDRLGRAVGLFWLASPAIDLVVDRLAD